MIDKNTFKRLDTFETEFGYGIVKFIVKGISENGVLVTGNTWLKSSGVFLSFSELNRQEVFPGKPYSKLRWLIKF